MFICPHCGKATHAPEADRFDYITMAKEECEHCGREFLIVGNVAMTQEQYEKK